MDKQKPLATGWTHIRKRPMMYFSDQVPAVVNFLEGFKTACLLLNPEFDYDSIYQAAIQERGWEHSANPIWRQMQERGMDNTEVITELLAIHQEIWTHLDLDAAQAIKSKLSSDV